MKKVKNLKKRIRRLEARMEKGARKLAKLKRRLEAAEAGAVAKAKKKPAVAAGKTGKSLKVSSAVDKGKQSAALKPHVKPAVVRKKKRKLNLTPERREQLAAAMRARWAAKRAAAGTNTQDVSLDSGVPPGDTSQPM